MQFLPRVLLLWLCAAFAARADDSLLQARRAQAMLGVEVWSQVIRIENTARHSAYPRTVHALVFEWVDRLWFYCSVDGTQSFSLHVDRVAEEKADFAPLLRDIEPGFVRWAVLPRQAVTPGFLVNGCFIDCVVALRARVAAGAAISEPRLLAYYADRTMGRKGHTVLVYRENNRVVLFDPSQPEFDRSFPIPLARDPLKLAREYEGVEVTKARFLSLPAPSIADSMALVGAQ